MNRCKSRRYNCVIYGMKSSSAEKPLVWRSRRSDVAAISAVLRLVGERGRDKGLQPTVPKSISRILSGGANQSQSAASYLERLWGTSRAAKQLNAAPVGVNQCVVPGTLTACVEASPPAAAI